MERLIPPTEPPRVPRPVPLHRRPSAPASALERLLASVRVDFPGSRPLPPLARLVVASVVAVVGSIAVDMLLVKIGIQLFPATRSFQHFRFFDYAGLTVVGVVIACVGWPVVTSISSRSRWLFLRLAILVTIVLLLPDLWILLQGEPPRAVAVLVVMHFAIAIVSYNALVRIAPARPSGSWHPVVDDIWQLARNTLVGYRRP